MKELFFPSSVVVIGVSSHPFNLGKEIARNLFEFQYTGEIHLVGLDGGIMFGRRIHKSLDEISDPIDFAVILTPAATVPGILEQCGRKGIRRALIESGGFGEFDDQGQELGEELNNVAGKYEIRFIGPNCIGIINFSNGLAVPFARLNNVFRKGGVGIIAQSGGVGLSFLNMFHSEQLGFSKFAAIGNKLNVDENDLLEYYVEDPETTVVCLYLESIKDGRRLTEIARRSSKPIVLHKANVGSLSQAAAQSHTEAVANDDLVVDAALRQSGIVRFRDMLGYLDFVKILHMPKMKGRNLAIVSRSGGHAVIATDAAHLNGFQLPPLSEDFLAEIRTHLRADVIRLANPLDLGDLFDFDFYIRILDHTLQQTNVDGVLFLHIYFAGIEGEASRRLLGAAWALAKKYDKPCALCVSTEQYEVSRLHKEFDFPIFMSPERAIHALDLSIKYHERRAAIVASAKAAHPAPPLDSESIRTVLDTAVQEKRDPLLHEAVEVIAAAGLNLPEHVV
ncbi:MAG: CoA-binding protein, partial [Deltaproteobacteria bacterium]|nr:CoA-binding protein [Deltaproteobacteria bacterium]